uniref:cysteine dioxygenase n=1 Tax=Oryza sativa subsp. japonica TaxID=39947 RepID=Q8S828_ORYSJ|nr:unknown protein [Oryza sativa Japonica Group]
MPPLLGVYDFTAGLPPSPPTGVLAYTVGWSHHRSWASTTSPPACLRRRRLVPPPTRLAYYAAAVGRLRLHHRPASVAADWCPSLYGRLVTPPLMGIVIYTAGLPPSPPTGVIAYTVGRSHHRSWASMSSPTGWPSPPPTGVSACTAGLLCRRCWASTTSPPACLRRRRLVSSPIRSVGHTTVDGHRHLHRRPASVAADWCPRLYGRLVTPPLMGIVIFTAGLPPSPPIGASAYTAGLLCRRCWASTTSPPACLRRRRVVPPPTRLAYYAAAVGRLRLHRRLASVAAEWCLRLHGWPIMPPLLGVYDFTTGLPPSPPTGVPAYTVGWIQIQICIKGIHGFKLISYALGMDQSEHHQPAASSAADWCFRLHGWPLMPPLLGVYVFTDRLVFAAADWCFRLHGWPLMLPLLGVYVFTDRPPRPPPTGASACTAGLYAAVVGRLRLHRPAASTAADWCFRLHGWPIMLPLLGVYVFTDRPPHPPLTGVTACTAGLLCRRCWASTTPPPACLHRRRLVFPPARLAFMPPLLGVYVFTDRLAFAAADWCFRLHGWPLCRRCWASTSSPTGLPSPLPTGVSACTAGLYAAVVGRLRLHRPACLRRCRLVFPPARLAFMPPLLGVYVFTDRLAFAAADWCFRLHGWPLCRRCWASTSSPTGRLVRRRLVLPPARLAYYAAVVGRLRLHRPACLRRHRLVSPSARLAYYAAVVGRLRLHRPACLRRCRLVFPPARLAFMPPLLGVYVFTDRLAFAAADWCFRLHGWPLCRRCWASTSSPTGRLVRRRLVLPPARLAYYAAVVGRLRLHRPACLRRHRLVSPSARLAYYAVVVGRLRLHHRLASTAADWCFRLHGWPLCRRCWASTTPPPACLHRRRLVFPPARWPIMPPLMGVCVFTDRLAFAAADWCFRLHGWPIMPPLLGVYVFTDRPPRPPPTGVSACIAGLL